MSFIIPKNECRLAVPNTGNVQVTVAVVIGERDATTDKTLLENRSGVRSCITPAASIEREELWKLLIILIMWGPVVNVTVGNEDIIVTIKVKIAHRNAESQKMQRRRVQSGD